MKRQIAANVVFVLALVAAVAGIVIYWINTHGGYYSDFTASIVAIAVAGIVVLLAIKALDNGGKRWVDILYPAAGVLLTIAAVRFLADRVESAAIILASDLEAGNALARPSIYTAFAGVICLVLAMILTGVYGMLNGKAEEA